jgi:hypothetical protein
MAIALLIFVATAAAEIVNPHAPPKWMTDKLEQTIIPRLEFREATLASAIEVIRRHLQQLDPQKVGVPIFLQISNTRPEFPDPTKAHITVSLTNIPVHEALKYVANLTGLKVSVRPDGIHIVTFDDPDPILTHVFALNPRQRAQLENALKRFEMPEGERQTIQDVLSAEGVVFSNGTTARLDEKSGALEVRNTFEELELLDTILEGWGAEPIPVAVPGPDVPKVLNWPSEDTKSDIERRADGIILRNVALVSKSLADAVQRLQELGVAYDPRREGVTVVLKLDSPAPSGFDFSTVEAPREIRYSAARVSLTEAIREVAKLAKFKVKVRNYAISVVPPLEEVDELITVEYLVLSPDVVSKRDEETSVKKTPSKQPDWLISSGVSFGPQKSAIFIPSSNKLIVRDTMEEQRRVHALNEASWREYYEKHPKESLKSEPKQP